MGKVMKDPYKVCINSITCLSAFQRSPYFLERTPRNLFIWQPDHAAFFQCHSTYSTTHKLRKSGPSLIFPSLPFVCFRVITSPLSLSSLAFRRLSSSLWSRPACQFPKLPAYCTTLSLKTGLYERILGHYSSVMRFR